MESLVRVNAATVKSLPPIKTNLYKLLNLLVLRNMIRGSNLIKNLAVSHFAEWFKVEKGFKPMNFQLFFSFFVACSPTLRGKEL